MADWRKLAMAAILADGKIDNTEVKLLRKELFADKKIDDEERDFLIALRNAAQKKAYRGKLLPAFEKLFFEAIENNVLADGVIDADEAKWLTKADLRRQEGGRQREEVPGAAEEGCEADQPGVRQALCEVHGGGRSESVSRMRLSTRC